MAMAENPKTIVDRKENNEILRKVRPDISLETMTKMLKMQYFGYLMRAHQSLDKDIMLGITAGARKKGNPRMRWMDDIKSVIGLSLYNLNQLVKDSKKWQTLLYNIVRKKKRTNVKSKEKAKANHFFENAAKYIHKDRQKSYRLEGHHHSVIQNSTFEASLFNSYNNDLQFYNINTRRTPNFMYV